MDDGKYWEAQKLLDERAYNQAIALKNKVYLANTGGAIAALSYLGTTAASGNLDKWALVPLLCFAIGAWTGLNTLAVALMETIKDIKELTNARHGLPKRDYSSGTRFEDLVFGKMESYSFWNGLAANLAFALGCFSGIGLLAIA